MPTVHQITNALDASVDHRVSPLRFGDAHLTTGVRLHYAEQGDPSGHPIILLHGYSDSWFSFSPVLPLLSTRHHVYALSQRGQGDSDRPTGGYAMRDLAADVLAFMDAMGVARATVVGHSMGSFVAQRVALVAPERVARLVLAGSATTMRNEVMFELERAVASLTDPVPEEFAREFQVSTIYQPLSAAFMDRVVAESLKLPAPVWQALLAGQLAAEHPAPLGKYRIPTLVLWGDRDAIFPRAEQDALVAALVTATLKVYRETGHALHWERPEEFVRDLETFISRTSAR